jgi:hypothetical protein
MRVSDREREQNERYNRVLPDIVEAILDDEARLDIARRIAHRTESDEKETYRWVTFVEEALETRRKRAAIPGLIAMWSAGVVFVSTMIAWIARGYSAVVPLLGGVCVALVLTTYLLLRSLSRRSAAAWLENQQRERAAE